MADLTRWSDEEYAEWYVWAKREVSSDNRVCHGAAQAALQTLAGGGDRIAAVQAARRSQVGQSVVLARQVPSRLRSYAEWYDWARREIGGQPPLRHVAARTAMDRLRQGGSAQEAAAAAVATVQQQHPDAGPAAGFQGSAPASAPGSAEDHPAPPEPAPAASSAPPLVRPAAPLAPSPAIPDTAVPYAPAVRVPVGDAAGTRSDTTEADAARAYAGFWARLVALLLDMAIVLSAALVIRLVFNVGVTVLLLLLLAISSAVPLPSRALVQLVDGVLMVVVVWLYFAILESSVWQATPGKRIVGIAVTTSSGGRASFWRATGRHFAKLVSTVLLLLGYLIAGFTARKQALHDLMAGTVVVRRPGSELAPSAERAAEASAGTAIRS